MRMRAVKFKTIVADPPWPFSDKLPGETRGAASNYEVMKVDSIESYLARPYRGTPVRDLIDDDALLFLWRVSSMQAEALRVMEGWRFIQKSEVVWVKTTRPPTFTADVTISSRPTRVEEFVKLAFGMGRYVRAAHETCLIGRRGKGKVQDRSIRSVFFAERRAHSQKPEEFYELVERLSPGPYLELFAAGHKRPGWTCIGRPHRAE